MRPPVQLKPADRPAKLFPPGYRKPFALEDVKVLLAVIAAGLLLVGGLVAGGLYIWMHPEGIFPALPQKPRPVVVETDAGAG